jgi:hypothetical protein
MEHQFNSGLGLSQNCREESIVKIQLSGAAGLEVGSTGEWTMNSVKIVEAFCDKVWKARRPEAIAQFVTDDVVLTSGRAEVRGKDNLISWARTFLAKINDFECEVIESFQNQDESRVASLWR